MLVTNPNHCLLHQDKKETKMTKLEVAIKKRAVILELISEIKFGFERRFELNVNPHCEHDMAERIGGILISLPERFNDRKIAIEKPTKLNYFNWNKFNESLKLKPQLIFKSISLNQLSTISSLVLTLLLERTANLHLHNCELIVKEAVAQNQPRFTVESLTLIETNITLPSSFTEDSFANLKSLTLKSSHFDIDPSIKLKNVKILTLSGRDTT